MSYKTIILLSLTIFLLTACGTVASIEEKNYPGGFYGATESEAKTARLAADLSDKGKPDPDWAGKILTVAVFSGGSKGGISGPLYFWRNEWEKSTGAKLIIIEIPFAEVREKTFTDFVTETGT